jgi:L-rhamnose isomerase/sugar isomerase
MAEGLNYAVKLHGEEKIEKVIAALDAVDIELPSWGFGRGGTRFAVYQTPDDAYTFEEKMECAAKARDLTGRGKTVALHFPWDGSTDEDIAGVKKALDKYGFKAGAVNPNLFSVRKKTDLDHRLRFGSITNPVPEVRKASIDHCRWCVNVMRKLGSKALSLWVPDGTNSPGQRSLYDQADAIEEAIHEIAGMLHAEETLLVEYKFFEPAFYSTAIPDWGTALALSKKSGENVMVLVDLGHHAPGTNVEQIVMSLVREGRLGGFHLNDSKYADDDLATGSVDASRLFRIMLALVEGEWRGLKRLQDVAFMIDESHNIKDATAEMIESIVNIETAMARALLVDIERWNSCQSKWKQPDPEHAEQVLYRAFNTDVRPILAERRRRKGLPEDPMRELIGA